MLLDPAEHEVLAGDAWDEERVRAAVAAIVARTAAASRGEPDHTLWTGTAGVAWALDRLGAEVDPSPLGAAAPPSVLPGPGLMQGETGPLLVSWRLAPSEEKAERLLGVVTANVHSPAHELFEGSPGTMLAALHVWEATGDERFACTWLESADVLLDRLRPDPELGCWIWIQHRRGRLVRSIGAGHGFASNVRVLLRGRALLGEDRTAEVERMAADTAARLALWDGEVVNWPTAADPYWAEQQPIRVQWCHGAPGIVTSLSRLPRGAGTDGLLTAAGELTWRAGPLRKGPGLCHGTAGNGCAFLALHARTGDEVWLERARAFAMHALAQVQASALPPSLWTGETGVAWFLAECLDGWQGMPVVDVL